MENYPRRDGAEQAAEGPDKVLARIRARQGIVFASIQACPADSCDVDLLPSSCAPEDARGCGYGPCVLAWIAGPPLTRLW